MQFNRLRLTGFKSFVEPTELFIEPGLTGLVGPNGCGKSNIVEALRWAMGETSAKQLRGGEMDDVIFNGTSQRPARNMAEVSLILDNAARTAPAAFNDSDELVLSRRIEREKGSVYRINGRDVRARDIQLMLADAATGARSPALVSQGKIGALINAKPAERRILLEDAAGIGGLHARRHEAELKLRQAEANLEQLAQVIQELERQFNALVRQSRQAKRYRELSAQIRRLDALRLHIAWIAAATAIHGAEQGLRQADAKVGETTAAATRAQTARAEASASLPPLRQAEVEAGAVLHRAQLERDRQDAEATRLAEERDALDEQLRQIEIDLTRETQLIADADATLTRLAGEQATLEAAQAADGGDAATDAQRLAGLEAAAGVADRTVDAATERLATATATRDTLARRGRALDDRAEALDRRRMALGGRRAQLTPADAGSDAAALAAALTEAETATTQARTQVSEAEATFEAARTAGQRDVEAAAEALDAARDAAAAAVTAARTALDTAREAGRAAEADLRERLDADRDALEDRLEAQRQTLDAATQTVRAAADRLGALEAEARGIEAALGREAAGTDLPPVLDALGVSAGCEAALAAALGDDLAAPAAEAAAEGRAWTGRQGQAVAAPLPEGAVPLSEAVAVPASLSGLALRLSQVGVVDAADGGPALAAHLAVGQRLVSRDGHLWRWDGFAMAPGAGDGAAAARLTQRNRLSELATAIAAAEDAVEAARADEAAAQADLETIREEIAAADVEASRALQALRGAESPEEVAARAALAEAEAAAETADADGRAALVRTRRTVADAEAAIRRTLTTARERLAAAQGEERAARGRHADAVQRDAANAAAWAKLEAEQAALDTDADTLEAERGDLARDRAALPDIDALTGDLAAARRELATQRQALAEVKAELDGRARAADARAQRLDAIAKERSDWTGRQDFAKRRVSELAARQAETEHRRRAIADGPEAAAAARAALDLKLVELVARRDEAAAALATAEDTLAALDRAASQATEAQAQAREARVRAEAGLERATQARAEVRDRIAEALETEPTHLAEIAEIEGDPMDLDALPPKSAVEGELERARRDRDAIGPVNLRADIEAEEAEERLNGLLDERADLEGAIGRLRGAVDELNAEGRGRLMAAFDRVDQNFRRLFADLFGGGKAHLALLENDDPLAVGLEVMASPPGKKLQSMSLLSGGEQALTALALLFAVFLVNPAPICVLDEVDAPLDDANVERFCALVQKMAARHEDGQETRFLVVTHHPLTMAKMNRLYGVTMSERGVSTLVSVDLERAESMRATG